MNKFLVASVLLFVGDMVLAYGSFYDSDREDVKEIKEEVEVLNNEIQRLHDKVDRLLSLCDVPRKDGVNTYTSDILEAEVGKEDREIRWPPLELLNVSRTWSPLTNETTYTVCYHDYGSGDDVTVELWSDPQGSYRFEDKESEMNPEEEGKTACTSVILISAFKVASLSIKRTDVFLSYTMQVDGYEDHSWLSEYNMEEEHLRSWNSYYYNISIMKEKAAKANQTVTDIQLNTIQVINDGDVVYDVYQDRQAVVKVRTHFLDKYSTDNLQVHMELINSTTATMDRTVCNLDDRQSSSSCTLLPNSKKLWDGMEVDIGIDTHVRDLMLSGYATVSATTTIQQENEHAFLKEITMTQDVVIRPTSQPGPYPDNFLNVNLTLEDDDLKVCQINDMDLCTLYCSAKGNNIEEVNFFRTVNGTTELIPSTSDESEVPVQHILSHRSSKSIQVPKPDVLQPEQAVQNVTCSARNQDGLTASTNISVDVMDQIRIVDNETYVETNDTAVMAVCTVQGYPLANVTLKATQHFSSGTFYNYDKELDFDNIMIQQNLTSFKVKVTGYLTVNEYSSEADVKEYLYIVSVICTAEAKYSDSVFIHEYASMSRDDTS